MQARSPPLQLLAVTRLPHLTMRDYACTWLVKLTLNSLLRLLSNVLCIVWNILEAITDVFLLGGLCIVVV